MVARAREAEMLVSRLQKNSWVAFVASEASDSIQMVDPQMAFLWVLLEAFLKHFLKSKGQNLFLPMLNSLEDHMKSKQRLVQYLLVQLCSWVYYFAPK